MAEKLENGSLHLQDEDGSYTEMATELSDLPIIKGIRVSLHGCSSFVTSKAQPGPEVIKLFPCSTQLSMKYFLLVM